MYHVCGCGCCWWREDSHAAIHHTHFAANEKRYVSFLYIFHTHTPYCRISARWYERWNWSIVQSTVLYASLSVHLCTCVMLWLVYVSIRPTVAQIGNLTIKKPKSNSIILYTLPMSNDLAKRTILLVEYNFPCLSLLFIFNNLECLYSNFYVCPFGMTNCWAFFPTQAHTYTNKKKWSTNLFYRWLESNVWLPTKINHPHACLIIWVGHTIRATTTTYNIMIFRSCVELQPMWVVASLLKRDLAINCQESLSRWGYSPFEMLFSHISDPRRYSHICNNHHSFFIRAWFHTSDRRPLIPLSYPCSVNIMIMTDNYKWLFPTSKLFDERS